MPLGFAQLGSAIGEGYRVPQSDIAGSLTRGFQIGQFQQAKREAIRLKREQEQAKQDEALLKISDSSHFDGIHPHVLPKLKEEYAAAVKEAYDLYAQNPTKNYLLARSKLQSANRMIDENRALSDNVKTFYATKDENLTAFGRHVKDAMNQTGDIRPLNGMSDPVTGEGINHNQVNFHVNNYPDINKARQEIFGNLANDFTQQSLGNHQEKLKFFIPKEAVQQTAKGLWSNEGIRKRYVEDNRDYLLGKYFVGVPKEDRSTQAMLNNPNVLNDLYGKFEKETADRAQSFAKDTELRNIPQSPQGAGSLNLATLNQNNGGSAIVMKRPITVNGKAQQKEFNVPVGTTYSYKPVDIQALRGDDLINLDGNIPLKGQSIQEVKTGNAVVVPIATKRLVDKNTGDVINVGEVVDEKRLKTAIDNGGVEYQPMLSVSGKVKNRFGKTSDVSALAPVSKHGNAVMLSQSKDDVPGTQQQLQSSIDEANKKNSELKHVPSKTYTSKQTSALSAFEKQLGRKPNAAELSKLLDKYK